MFNLNNKNMKTLKKGMLIFIIIAMIVIPGYESYSDGPCDKAEYFFRYMTYILAEGMIIMVGFGLDHLYRWMDDHMFKFLNSNK